MKSGLRSVLACLFATASYAHALEGVPDVFHGFPRDRTLVPGQLYYRSPTGMGRITAIAYHNGTVYTQNIAGGIPRAWKFTDLADPGSLQLQPTNDGGFLSGDGSHGYHKQNGGCLGRIKAISPGVNQNVRESDPLRPGSGWIPAPASFVGRDGRSSTYFPWDLPFTWHQYGDAAGFAYIRRGQGAPIVEYNWYDLGATHLGKAMLLGDILLLVDDNSNGGVTSFDMGPVFQNPPQPPKLLDHINLPPSQNGMGTYLPQLWKHILVLHSRNNRRADFVDIRDPRNLRYLNTIPLNWNTSVEPGNNDLYAQAQDDYVFTRRAKIDMRGLLEEGGNAEIALRFDIMGSNRPEGSVAGAIDISQYLLPVGNLLITGPYNFSGRDALGVWAHQAEPDTRQPEVSYHRPEAGQTNFPLGCPVSLVINETLEATTLIDGVSAIVRPLDGDPLVCELSFSHDDILTLTPVQGLQPNTTYEVVIPEGGIKDVANNGIKGHTFRFSTGSSVVAPNEPPAIGGLTLSATRLEPGGGLTVSVAASHPQGLGLEYRFSPGDGTERTEWGADPTFQHVFATSGHFVVRVEVRASNGEIARIDRVVTVAPAKPEVASNSSGPMWLDAAARRLWVVNPDNDSVAVMDADSNEVLAIHDLSEHAAGERVTPHGVCVDGQGQVWVAARDDDAVYVLSASNGALIETLALDYGSAPVSVLPTLDGQSVLVVTTAGAAGEPGHGQVIKFDAATKLASAVVELGPQPRAMAQVGPRLFISRFISPETHGEIWEVETTGGMGLTRTFRLEADRGPDDNNLGRGVPNFVAGLEVDAAGERLFFSAVKANVFRGALFENDATHDSTVRAMLGVIDLVRNEEPMVDGVVGSSHRIDLDNSDSPTGIAMVGEGDWLAVALQGNDNVAVFDDLTFRSQPTVLGAKSSSWRLGCGSAPQGVRFDRASGKLFVKNFMSRDVSVHDLSAFFERADQSAPEVARPRTAGVEKLEPEVLRGKQLFYLAGADTDDGGVSEMSLESYISCATCHVDGGSDHRVFDFTQRGEGLRNTTDLRGRAGTKHGNVHWSGNFDEIQDFELDIVNHFGGAGFLPTGSSPNDSLGAPNAERSADLDALAAYVTSLDLTKVPRSPWREPTGQLSEDAREGALLFAVLECATCHDPASEYTDSQLGAARLHDVGTLRGTSGFRLGGTLPGIDTPTLHGVWCGAPYLHDGSAKTLSEVFATVGGSVLQAEAGGLSGGAQVVTDGDQERDDSALGDAFARLGAAGATVEFTEIDGGGGGSGQLELRLASHSPARVRVEWGADHREIVLDGSPSRVGWAWQRVNGLAFEAGTANAARVVLVEGGAVDLDAVLIGAPADLAKTLPHRRVLGLPEAERAKLIEYLYSLDGQRVIAPVEEAAGVATGFVEAGGIVSMEAESGDFSPDTSWEMVPQSDASGGVAVRIRSGLGEQRPTPSDEGAHRIIQYRFSVEDDSATYRLFGRNYFPSTNSDSFFWRLDGGVWNVHNAMGTGSGVWQEVAAGLSLSGSHLLEITYREGRAMIDKLVLVRSGLAAPTGLGSAESSRVTEGRTRPAVNAYRTWRERFGVEGEANETVPGKPHPNLLYYAMNLDPRAPKAKAAPEMSILKDVGGGRREVRLLTRERVNDAGVRVTLEVSSNPANGWQALEESPHQLERVVVDPDAALDGTTQLVLYRVTSEEDVLFFRVRVGE